MTRCGRDAHSAAPRGPASYTACGAPGTDDQQPDLANFRLAYEPLQPGDLMVLCTDGVHDNLDPQV